VEHLTFAVAVGRVDAVEKRHVKMRRKAQVAVGALDDGHRTGLAGWQAAVSVAFLVPGRDRVGEDTQNLAEQFPVEGERKAQREGHCEHELS
jgi:hypothetical protein